MGTDQLPGPVLLAVEVRVLLDVVLRHLCPEVVYRRIVPSDTLMLPCNPLPHFLRGFAIRHRPHPWCRGTIAPRPRAADRIDRRGAGALGSLADSTWFRGEDEGSRVAFIARWSVSSRRSSPSPSHRASAGRLPTPHGRSVLRPGHRVDLRRLEAGGAAQTAGLGGAGHRRRSHVLVSRPPGGTVVDLRCGPSSGGAVAICASDPARHLGVLHAPDDGHVFRAGAVNDRRVVACWSRPGLCDRPRLVLDPPHFLLDRYHDAVPCHGGADGRSLRVLWPWPGRHQRTALASCRRDMYPVLLGVAGGSWCCP